MTLTTWSYLQGARAGCRLHHLAARGPRACGSLQQPHNDCWFSKLK